MRKTFKQITAGDIIFRCYSGNNTYEKIQLFRVDEKSFYYEYREYQDRTDKYSMQIRTNGSPCYLFTTEVDAIRFCKAQMMKVLFAKIDEAQKAIKSIKDFRLSNYELLNHEWTDNRIAQLEKEANS